MKYCLCLWLAVVVMLAGCSGRKADSAAGRQAKKTRTEADAADAADGASSDKKRVINYEGVFGPSRHVTGDEEAVGEETTDIYSGREPRSLSVAIADAAISERGGATQGTVTRSGPTHRTIIVNLSCDDTSEITIPRRVFIHDGKTSVTFDIKAVDDAEPDRTQRVTISAEADGYSPGGNTVDVTDDEPVPADLVVDDCDAEVAYAGIWKTSSYCTRGHKKTYHHDDRKSKGTKSARFTPKIPEAGRYEVSIWFPDSGGFLPKQVPVDVIHADGTSTVVVDQTTHNGRWRRLGVYPFKAGTEGSVLIRTDGTDGKYVVADAVRFFRVTSVKPRKARPAAKPTRPSATSRPSAPKPKSQSGPQADSGEP